MARWSEDQLADHLQRRGLAGSPPVIDTSIPPFLPPMNDAGAFARGRLPNEGMNKTESAYDAHLWQQRSTGDVLWHKYEAIKLRLGDGSYYKPDFAVLMRDCLLEIHETKGFWREAARVRIKVAAGMYPFKFIAITRKNGGWEREEFS